jgi:hypothetical protein
MLLDLSKNQAMKAGVETGAFAGQVAGLFADLGTATTVALGLAKSLANLAIDLADIGGDIKYMKKGNRRLADPGTIDLTIFDVCPILGCYLLVCSTDSNIVNIFVADIGLPGWMDKVETIKKKKLDPMRKICNELIFDSRLTLTGLSQNKGLSPQTMKQKAKHWMNKLGKTTTSTNMLAKQKGSRHLT